MWDEQLNLPLPPMDAVFDMGAANLAGLVAGGLAALVLLFGLKYWRDTRNPIVLVMMVGGLATTLVEPFLDVIGAAWHPIHGQNTAFTLMGRAIPWWVVASYLCYFGGIGSLNYLAFAKGVTMRGVWLWFAIPMLFDILQEQLMMTTDLYYYYGNQPLILFGRFPLWWAPCNSMGEFLGVSLLALFGTGLRGWKLLLVPLIMPIGDAVGFAMVGLPPIIAVNSMNVSPALGTLAGLVCFGLAALVVRGVALVLGTDSPLRASRPRETPIADLLRRPAIG
jgi:hypothetical protein